MAQKVGTIQERGGDIAGFEGNHVAARQQMLTDVSRTAVAAVLSNWHNVLRAINMASSKYTSWSQYVGICADSIAAKLPKPKEDEDAEKKVEPELPLPQTLVRIPTQHAPALLSQTAPSGAD